MADSTKPEAEEGEVEETESTPTLFLLKSVVRSRFNRTQRAAQPGRMPFVQRLAGGSILVRRARPARITEAALLANIEEIKRLVSRHQIVVTTMSGQVVSLETLEAAPAPAVKPLPNPPLDSAKNDKNENIGYNVPPTPEGTTLDAPTPELLKGTALSQMEDTPPHDPPPDPELPAVESDAVPEPDAVQDPVDAFLDSHALPPEEPEKPHKHRKGKKG